MGRVLFARDTRPTRAFAMRLIYILCIYVRDSVIITAVKYHGGRNYKNGSIHLPTTAQLSTQNIRPITLPAKTTLSRAIANAFPRKSPRFPSRAALRLSRRSGIRLLGRPADAYRPAPLILRACLHAARHRRLVPRPDQPLSRPPGHAPMARLFPPKTCCGGRRVTALARYTAQSRVMAIPLFSPHRGACVPAGCRSFLSLPLLRSAGAPMGARNRAPSAGASLADSLALHRLDKACIRC